MVERYPGLGYNLSGAIKGFGSLRPVTGACDTRKSRGIGGKMPAEIGDVAPDFKLPSADQGDITLSGFRGQKTVVLSFHVFDFTAG